MRETMAIVGFCIVLGLHGTNVQWGDVALDFIYEDAGVSTYDVHRSLDVGGVGMAMTADLRFTVSKMGSSVVLESVTSDLLFAGSWLEMGYGDVVSMSTARNVGSYFYHIFTDEGIGEYSTYDITVQSGEDFYLAFAAALDASYTSFAYGWVGLKADDYGHLTMTGSAVDLDGGPMVVGGGAYTGATPEPSAGLLLLVGAAALGLRRRGRRGM